jgi:hypothetical protein
MSGLRLVLFGVALVVAAAALSNAVASMGAEFPLVIMLAVIVFVAIFIKPEMGLYVVLVSMLLSPEITLGTEELAEARQGVVFRIEDLLLMLISLSWVARMAVDKDVGLVVKTPLNRPILAYVVTTLLATLLGYLTGSVKTAAGFFYVLKYVEYFVVYYLTANYLRDRRQAWRLIAVAFLTAVIVSLIGMAQIPSGQRVSAPFEGEVSEPNTFGGYLLLMMAIAAGLALESQHFRTKALSVAMLVPMAIAFAFTLSRASYLGLLPAVAVLAMFSTQRWITGTAFVVFLTLTPLFVPALRDVLPAPIVRRITETFEPQAGQPLVRFGRVGFDPSTSERLISMQGAWRGWLARPVLGHGVTGYAFMDVQYARTLVETGALGLGALLWLLWGLARSGLLAFRSLQNAEDRGVALGFLAGTVGLLTHAVGSNTFIIVRIMEPFWFFAAVVLMLPTFQRGAVAPSAPVPALGSRP